MDPYRIRPAQASDTAAIRALIAAVYSDYGYQLDVRHEDTHLQDPGPYFRAGGGEFWVAECHGGGTDADCGAAAPGRIVATGAVYFHDDGGGTAEIKTIYVARDHRRRGLGRRMTTLALNHASRHGRRVFLWSDTLFVEAHALYKRLGFHRSGERRVDCVNHYSEYRYELK